MLSFCSLIAEQSKFKHVLRCLFPMSMKKYLGSNHCTALLISDEKPFCFFVLLNKKEQLGNKRNSLCKLPYICIMSYSKHMQMKCIIYERLCLSHSVPITYKEIPPLLLSVVLSKLAWHAPHSQTRPTKQALTKGLASWAPWLGGKKNLSGGIDGRERGRQW